MSSSYTRSAHFKNLLDRYYSREQISISSFDYNKIKTALDDQKFEYNYNNISNILRELNFMKLSDNITGILRLCGVVTPKINNFQCQTFCDIYEEFNRIDNLDKNIRMTYIINKIAHLLNTPIMHDSIYKLDKYDETWEKVYNNSNIPKIVERYHTIIRGIKQVQLLWRAILLQRQIVRSRIGEELESLPGVGINYFNALENFEKMKCLKNNSE